MGLGCALTWLGIIMYTDDNPNVHSVLTTVMYAKKNIYFYILSVAPIFIGFSLLFLTFFFKDSEKFKDVKERNIHYKTAHKGEAIFHCNQCQESFVSKYSLMRHREKHKNITYTCEVCSATFSVRHPLR